MSLLDRWLPAPARDRGPGPVVATEPAAGAGPEPAGHDPRAIALSLVSHTNVGKTTLARTLLREDIGEVRDAAHVTEFADVRTLIETADGERLLLWDTPGFGDSVRLARRMREASQPVGWFLSQVWDRWRDRPFWASQQALRNLRDEADAMLYLVNAGESPEAAGYLAPEMELLAWLDKPVVVLLNQLGPPQEPAREAAELERWRGRLRSYAAVRAVLPLDAFARCWVQEATLLRAVEQAFEGERRVRMGRLRAAWEKRDQATFDAAMRETAAGLARAATAAEPLPAGGGLRATLRSAGAKIGIGSGDDSPTARAQEALAHRLEAGVRDDTVALVRLHGLEGSAERTILDRLQAHYQLRLRVDEGQAALWGGVVSGALLGLKADLLSGGLTLGGGLLTGGVLGALGSAGLARCVNLVRGTASSWVTWNAATLDAAVEAALLRYLAVAHFGRGRGEWAESESPPHWKDVVAAALAPHRPALAQVWSGRVPPGGDAAARDGETASVAAALEPIVRDTARTALRTLYPSALQPAPRDDPPGPPPP